MSGKMGSILFRDINAAVAHHDSFAFMGRVLVVSICLFLSVQFGDSKSRKMFDSSFKDIDVFVQGIWNLSWVFKQLLFFQKHFFYAQQRIRLAAFNKQKKQKKTKSLFIRHMLVGVAFKSIVVWRVIVRGAGKCIFGRNWFR